MTQIYITTYRGRVENIRRTLREILCTYKTRIQNHYRHHIQTSVTSPNSEHNTLNSRRWQRQRHPQSVGLTHKHTRIRREHHHRQRTKGFMLTPLYYRYTCSMYADEAQRPALIRYYGYDMCVQYQSVLCVSICDEFCSYTHKSHVTVMHTVYKHNIALEDSSTTWCEHEIYIQQPQMFGRTVEFGRETERHKDKQTESADNGTAAYIK